MKLSVRRFLRLMVLVIVASNTSSAQTEQINASWLANDIAAIELIQLLISEDQNLQTIKAILGRRTRIEENNLGFGAKRIQFHQGNGYTSLSVTLLMVRGEIKDFRLKVSGSRNSWPQIRNYIIEAWKMKAGPEFSEIQSGLEYHRSTDAGLGKIVAEELGELQEVILPNEFKSDYELLMSAEATAVVGAMCGYAGVTPAGQRAIDALFKARRIDLIENILRGYNPGGRVHAALALLKLEEQGFHLNDEIRATIKKVSELDIEILTCSGCIYSRKTAKEILGSFQKQPQ
jgi:hypothetical protein